MSASLSGHWSNLFGSFTEQNASRHKLNSDEALSPSQADPDHSTTSHLSAAMHQSAAFAALFDDMVSSQSYSAYLQQPAVTSTHSSAASVCDSATSFSFQTAQHARTQPGSISSISTKPATALVDMSTLSQPRALGIGHSQEPDLAATLKDWQISRGCARIAGQRLTQQAASLSAEQGETSTGLKLLTTSISGQKPSGVSARHRLNMDSADGHDSSQILQPVASPAAARAKQASRQARRAAKGRQCAPHKGMMVIKPWSTAQQVKAMTDASEVSRHDVPVTASQAVRVHLNKVAWWLDLQASQSMSQLHSMTASNTSMPVVEASGPKSDGIADFGTVCESVPSPAASSRHEDSSKMAGVALGPTGAPIVSRSKPVDTKQSHMQPPVILHRSIAVPSQLPSASTELFLQLEAATAVEPEQDACSFGVSKSPCTSGSITAAAADTHLGSQEASCNQPPLVSESMQQLEALQDDQQLLQVQQAVKGAEEDVYAGLERGSELQTEGRPTRQFSNAAASSPQQAAVVSADVTQQGGDADTVQHASTHGSSGHWSQLSSRCTQPGQVGSSCQQAQASSTSQLGLFGNAHHACGTALEVQPQDQPTVSQQGMPETALPGRSRLQPRALSPAVTPKAAEAPLTKQGSYAMAARQARHRSERQQKETQQLAAHKPQKRTATANKQPAQADKPQGGKASTHGLLIGSYCQPATAHAPAQAADSHAVADTSQPLSAMASRPSTVMSANCRYASTLATEASSSCSEPESAAKSAAELTQPESQMTKPETKAASFSRQALVGKETVRPHASRQGSVGSHAARGPSPCLGLQAQLREQHPFEPLTVPLQRHSTSHKGQVQCNTAAVRRQDGSLVQAAQQHTKSVLDEELQLVASLKKLDHQPGSLHHHNNTVSHDVMQPRCPPELQWEATSNTTAPLQAGSDRLLSPAQHSRLHALHHAKPGPAKPGMIDSNQSQQLRPFGRAFAPRLGAGVKGAETADSPLRRTSAAAAADRAPCPLARPVLNGSNMRTKGRTRAKRKDKNHSPDGKHAAAVAVGRDSGDVSNSAEQRLLQSSLARLDARLSRLTAKSGGGQTPHLQAILPSSVSAPITRQPSFILPPTSPTATHHGLPSRPFSVAADGQHQGLPTGKGADRRPEAGLQLPQLHPSPSVASDPCSGQSGFSVARGLTGPHGKAPGAARAALLARSRIPRSPKPEHLPHHQLQQLPRQLQLPSQGYGHMPGTACQLAVSYPDHVVRPTSSVWHQQQHQQQLQSHKLTPPYSPYAAMQLPVSSAAVAQGQQQYVQEPYTQLPRMSSRLSHGEAQQSSHSAGVGIDEGIAEANVQPWYGPARHQPQPGTLQHQQQGFHQEGQAQQVAIASQAASTAASVAGASPRVQHAWYPSLPEGYQPPLMGMLMQPGLVQQPSVVSMPDAAQPSNAQAPAPLQQFYQDHNQAGSSLCQACANEAAIQGDRRQQPVSVGNQEREAMQSAPSQSGPVHMQTWHIRPPVLQAESSVLSVPVRSQKGIIKAYNLNALMA
ncbi:hypothetical protein WJX77_006721 [Trebouxia sp. C0004]